VVLYAAWQPLPQRIWNATGPLEWAIVALFYLAWALVLIGALLPGQTAGGTAPPDTLRVPLCQPLYVGILLAMWATSTMTDGHLLLATTVTGYLLFDSIWEARKTQGARETHARIHSRASASRVSA
jgi:protein-S-isoprenylcysteine O-methyltransferase Ste14